MAGSVSLGGAGTLKFLLLGAELSLKIFRATEFC